MNPLAASAHRGFVRAACILAGLAGLAGCRDDEPGRIQGYIEGEFVYVASPLGGRLRTLSVGRGDQVEAGQTLFELDSSPEEYARDEAQRQLAEAQARLADATKGLRPSEIESLEAQLRQAKAAEDFDTAELRRQEELSKARATSAEALDRARALLEQDHQRVMQLEADLTTARLGSRVDQIAAAEARVRALEAALVRAQWNLDEKTQAAAWAGEVTDTLYSVGEWVPPDRPVVVMLPPEKVKLRAFVSQARVATIARGDVVRVYIDGAAGPVQGSVSFVSPKAEYTPPVIYSQSSRQKLVFLIEAVFQPAVAAQLHPGQPVDVELAP